MSMDPGAAELAAIRSEFCNVVARWRLTQADLRALLGKGAEPFVEGRVLPDRFSADAEQRMRLLVRFHDAVKNDVSYDDLAAHLRRQDSLGRTTLEILGNLSDLRLALALAEGRQLRQLKNLNCFDQDL